MATLAVVDGFDPADRRCPSSRPCLPGRALDELELVRREERFGGFACDEVAMVRGPMPKTAVLGPRRIAGDELVKLQVGHIAHPVEEAAKAEAEAKEPRTH